MSIDKSLKSKSGLVRRRNVLTRDERIAVLEEGGKWREGDSLFGLPKVRVVNIKRRGKAKRKKEEGEGAAAPK